jgi:hypothetical protein
MSDNIEALFFSFLSVAVKYEFESRRMFYEIETPVLG